MIVLQIQAFAEKSTCNIKEREYQTFTILSLASLFCPLLSDPVDNVAMETAKLAKNDRNKVYFVMRTKSSAWRTYQALRAHAIIGQLINSVHF